MDLYEIKDIIGAPLDLILNEEVKHLLTDSRKAVIAQNSLFFCIKGKNHDAHDLIPGLVEKGVRNFVVEKPINGYTNCTFLLVNNSVEALQKIATAHRQNYNYPVIAIGGSNGKTIVKEWLSNLLTPEKKVVKSPKSYNSQIGVPLSVWQMKSAHEIGVFEAGISQVAEMGNLEKIIKPTFGIFTNLGSAHSEGFSTQKEKLKEKMSLFKDCAKVIIHEDFVDKKKYRNQISWGESEGNDYVVKFYDSKECSIKFKGKGWTFLLPFVQNEYRENLLHCIISCLEIGILPSQSKINELQSLPMRMSLKKGLYNTDLIDDTYNNDLAGLQVALDFMSQQVTDQPKTLILSAMHESGMEDEALNERIQELIDINHLHQVIAIGESLKLDSPDIQYFHFDSTEELAETFNFEILKDHLILIKGAREFKFEKIVERLEVQVHQTVFEINFEAFQQNLNYFKSVLKKETGVMAMVKAFAYGSGHNEIAHFLEHNRIDYFGVAYIDEGVNLRNNGITTPIMVMNPTVADLDVMIKYNLEPEVYDFYLLENILEYSRRNTKVFPIHIKLDTGMHRLGFEQSCMEDLLVKLESSHLLVKSVFSHLAAADMLDEQEFTKGQCESFKKMADQISEKLTYKPMYHILNSAGIHTAVDYQFDMVRLGIGLYGVGVGEKQKNLAPTGSLKTTISQIKKVKAGETIGYGRKGKAINDTTIATIPIGYADGYDRRFSNGVGKMNIQGILVPVIGNVCMDMTMIDITGLSVSVGETVTVFGENPTINELAEAIDTIPYEILTNVSERVKRVFFSE